MKRKEITMTISEFLDYTEKTKFERFFENTEFKVMITMGLAVGLILLNSTIAVAGQPNLNGIDRLGNTFLSLVRKSGYWICLVMGAVNCIKVGLQGGDKAGDIMKVIFKYVLIFASLYLLPFLFDLVKESFA